MGQSLYINFDAENLLAARVRGATDLRSQNFTQFVAGDSLSLDLFLVGSSGALNIQDYAEVRLGMGGLDARPESGSYVVAGTDTLSYDHTAAELETVIDSQVAGATVTKLTDFVFKVQFDAVGEQTIPSLDFINVQPRSTVSVTRLTTGTATTKESWLWRLYRNPVAFTNTFTNIAGDGIRGTLSLATAGIYDLLAQNEDVRTFFEVELTDTDGNVRTVLQAKVKLNGEVIGHNFSGSIPTSPTNSPEANAFLESFPDPTIEGDLTVGGFDLPTGAVDGYVLTSDANGIGTWAAGGGGAEWGDITGTLSSQTDLQSALDAKKVRTDANGAFSAGDLGGNARGTNAINIQATRSAVTQVASGSNSVAIGNWATASGYYASALGPWATASGYYSTASGYGAGAGGYRSTASGCYASASGYGATASGYQASAEGSLSTVLGHLVKTTVDKTTEIGYWQGFTSRAGAIRVHRTGQVGLTTPTTDTAFLPSVLTNGSEIDGTLAAGMAATRIGSTDNELITEVNRAGTIAKFSAPRIDSNGAVSIGDLGGNARGANAINIQATRSNVTQVASGTFSTAISSLSTASGYYSTAVGYQATASVYKATALGAYSTASAYNATAVGSQSTASGWYATALGHQASGSGYYSTAVGYVSSASGLYGTAVGYFAKASASGSTVIGYQAETTVDNTTEIGYWYNDTTRAGAIRVHGTGMVSQTIQNRATAYTDGGETVGSEADNTVIREGIALRRNGNEILIDLNIDGTVTTLSLGTAS